MSSIRSAEIHAAMKEVMPFGSSTCSKAPRFAPDEPGVITRGKGCRVWDADGREYIDFKNGLGPITLGYRFPAIDDAVVEQLASGIVFSSPHPLEGEVAELICSVIPCAEQARFLKTGGEACAACIKIARAYTSRNHIIQIGYNGWLNSLSASGNALPNQPARGVPPGVPEPLSRLHHACRWNDREQVATLFKDYPDQIAAVIVSASYPEMELGHEFYPFLRRITSEHDTLLIFDEIVTGFRIALGGAQEYFGVKPDLAVFAKGMANGMPLSVYTGKREVMQACMKAIVSSTYGGETLSLAAARAAINVYREQGVIKHLWKIGDRMWSGLGGLFNEHGIPAEIKGFAPCPAIVFSGKDRAALSNAFMRSAFSKGVCLYSTSYVNFSHTEADIDEALDRLSQALKTMPAPQS